MESLQKSLHAAKKVEDEYRRFRQRIGLEVLHEIHKEQACNKLRIILNEIKETCKEIDGFMSKEMIQKIDSIIAQQL